MSLGAKRLWVAGRLGALARATAVWARAIVERCPVGANAGVLTPDPDELLDLCP